MKEYIAIIRASTERQDIETQKDELLDFIKKDGVDLDKVTVIGEAGASAIKQDERYRKNIELVYSTIESNPVKCVYAWSLDRIGRNEELMMRFKSYLISHGVNLKIVNPSLVLLNEDGSTNLGMELALSLYTTLSAQEMQLKQERFRRGKKRNVEQGRFIGGPNVLFGYHVNENGYVVPDPVNSEIVITMFTLYSSGEYSGSRLSDELYERYGKRISQEVVAEYLRNPTYCGRESGRNVTGRKYPSIISEELFDKCRVIAKQNTIMEKTGKVNLCTGILKCPVCGSRFYNNFTHYRCYGRIGKHCSNTAAIHVAVIEPLVWDYARMLETDALLESRSGDIDKYNDEIRLLETKISNLKSDSSYMQKTKNTKLLFARDMIDEAEFEKLMKEHEEGDKARRESIQSYSEKIRLIKSNIKRLESSDEIKRLVEIHAELASLDDKLLMKDIIKRQIRVVGVKIVNVSGKCYEIVMEARNGGVKSMLYYTNKSGPRYWIKINDEWTPDPLYAKRI